VNGYHKKYPSLDDDIEKLSEELMINPTMGIPLGMDCYKIRLKISSKNTGKSGGARVITYVAVINNEVILLTIYDKSERERITEQQVRELLEELQW
jgi:hypothetical protein